MSKRVLIASYIFPPFPGIGGRRWAKFAKELARQGYQVDVIAARNPFGDSSPWAKDLADDNIQVHRLEPRFPRVLMMRPNNVADKVAYKLSLFKVKRATKGNYYDRAILWKDSFLRLAKRLIKQHEHTNLIATGAPFHVLHQASLIKMEHPELNFVADFRDPWTNNENFMGFDLLTDERREFEHVLEQKVIDRADTILTVADPMTTYLEGKRVNEATKFITLPNGYDPDDMPVAASRSRRSDQKIRFILTGTLYEHLSTAFGTFVSSLVALKEEEPAAFSAMQFDFYGDAPQTYRDQIQEAGIENVHFNDPIPLSDVYGQIGSSDICMLFLQDHLPFSFSTKFYEYLYMGKKIVVFSRPGETADFITKNQLGYAAGPENGKEVLLQIWADKQEDRLLLDSDFDVEEYSVARLTEQLTQHLR
jgi:glycosyltransferase involved in cell wall biosynthesis